MSTRLSCPHCRRSFTIPDTAEFPCPACGRRLKRPAAAPAPEVWSYARGRQRLGPVTLAQLQLLANAGQLAPTDMILRHGEPKWIPAGTCRGLKFGAKAADPAAPCPRVFISHATADREFVEREILPLLSSKEIGFWYSKESIMTGSLWETSIRQGLEACDWFLIVLSPRSVASPWVQAEVHWAMDNRRQRIVPLLYQDCAWQDLHLMIRTIQHVDFRGPDRTRACARLLEVWESAKGVPSATGGTAAIPQAPQPNPADVWRETRLKPYHAAIQKAFADIQVVAAGRDGLTQAFVVPVIYADEAEAIAYVTKDLEAHQMVHLPLLALHSSGSQIDQEHSRGPRGVAYDVRYTLFAWTIGDEGAPMEDMNQILDAVLKRFANGRTTVKVPGVPWETELILESSADNLTSAAQIVPIVKYRFDLTARIYLPRPVAPAQAQAAAAKLAEGKAHSEQGDFEVAIACCTEALRLRPDFAEAYRQRAFAYREQGKFESSIADYDHAILLDPENADYFFFRGNCRSTNGDRDKALIDYQEAIRLAPDNAEYRNARAIVGYLTTGRFDEAVPEFTRVLEIDSEFPLAYACRAACHLQRGEFDLALADYTEAIRRDPDPLYFRNRAKVHRQRGEFDLALADISEALKLNPTEAANLATRAELLLEHGEEERALADYSEALRLDRADPAHPLARGQIYLRRKDYDRALRDFNEALSRDVRCIDALLHRAVVHMARGDKSRCEVDLTKAKELDASRTARFLDDLGSVPED